MDVSNYHFIIKELADKFEGKFNSQGDNTETYITFPVPIEKGVTRVDKNGEEVTKTISYRLQFVDRARFMASSLTNSVDNLSEKIHKIKCTNVKKTFLNTQTLNMIYQNSNVYVAKTV